MEVLVRLLLLISLATALKSPAALPRVAGGYTYSRLSISGRPKQRSPLKVVDTVIELKRGQPYATSLSAVYLQALRSESEVRHGPYSRQSRVSSSPNPNGTTPLIDLESGSVYVAPITVGSNSQSFDVVIDTGSSDPWLATAGYQCVNPASMQNQTEDLCYFGPAYNPAQSSTYQVIGGENFNVTYADGEVLNGAMGYEKFTMAGLTVPQQEFGAVNYAAWYGDGNSSGLVGFAYRTLTSAYAGTNPKADGRGQTLMYNPLFVNMYSNLGVAPVFSMALSRDANQGGVMALGGIPDIPHSPTFISAPIIPVGVNSSSGELVYEFYTVEVDGFAYASAMSTQFNPYNSPNRFKKALAANNTQVIIDSGTSLVYVPDDVALDVANSFSPPATFDNTQQAYFVACNATAPVFGVNIGGKVFYVNPADLILPATSSGRCVSSVQPNMGGLTILGDVWMKSVLCVFDLGAEEMRFAAREFYGLSRRSGK